jgi:hypothetical protein
MPALMYNLEVEGIFVNVCALLPPYRYKIFGKALARIQSDSQVIGDLVILL